VNSDAVERKLAAILSADVVGYSRLMAEDETATIRTLTDYREAIAMLVRQHRGRVVDSPGDNLPAFREPRERRGKGVGSPGRAG
jgi:adenylate cyclase